MDSPAQQITYSFTNEQFEQLMQERKDNQARLDQALSVASSLQQQLLAINAGLKHFTQQQVAELFGCSDRQLRRYAADGKLVPRNLFGKIMYPADVLLEFLSTYDPSGQIGDAIRQQLEVSQRTRRSRRSRRLTTGQQPTARS